MIKEYTNPPRTSLKLEHLSLTPKLILYYFYILTKRVRRPLWCVWEEELSPSIYSSTKGRFGGIFLAYPHETTLGVHQEAPHGRRRRLVRPGVRGTLGAATPRCGLLVIAFRMAVCWWSWVTSRWVWGPKSLGRGFTFNCLFALSLIAHFWCVFLFIHTCVLQNT
jgi:hypothetical protein